MKDYYQLLNISRWASPEQIKHAYREYAKHFHPDRHQNSAFFTERFREIQEAYEVLSDPQRRASYDARSGGQTQYQQTYQSPPPPPPPPPRPSAEQAREIATLRRYIEELEARLEAYRALEPWYRTWQSVGQLWQELKPVIRNPRTWVGVLVVVFNLFRFLNHPSVPPTEYKQQQFQSMEEATAAVRSDRENGRAERAIKEAAPFLSTRYSPIGFSSNQAATLFCERARAKAVLGNDTGAVNDCTKGLFFDPKGLPDLYVERGRAYRHQGYQEQALTDFAAALQLDGNCVGAYYSRGGLHYVAGRYQEALADYEQIVRLQPMVPEYRKLLGACYWKMGQASEACRHWEQAAAEGSSGAADSAARYCRQGVGQH